MPTTVDLVRTPFRVEITARTRIAAPAAQTWASLTDTATYPQWNPFVRRLSGTLALGERLEVDLKPGAGEARTMRPTVVELEPGRSFSWLGRVGLPGVLDGRHRFTVQDDGAARSILVQHEVLSGLLVPAFRRMLTVDTPTAFAALNDALAARVERLGAGSAT